MSFQLSDGAAGMIVLTMVDHVARARGLKTKLRGGNRWTP